MWDIENASDMELRFLSKINITTSINDCWNWQAGCDRDGYGHFGIPTGETRAEAQGRSRTIDTLAHRLSFFLWSGWWPDQCRHYICGNPPCCNPYHLRDGSVGDNNRDTYEQGRRKDTRGPDGKFTVSEAMREAWEGATW